MIRCPLRNTSPVMTTMLRATLTALLLSIALAFAAGNALAHNCPNEMKAIDAKLATNP